MDRILRRHLHDTRLLAQLRGLRERSAQRTCHVASQACELARQAVQEGQARVARLHEQRKALGRACADPALAGWWSWMPLAQARRDQLDEQIERAEYALIDEEEALVAAADRQAAADQAWRRARSRVQAVHTLVDQARRHQALASERVDEQEQADVGSGRLMMGIHGAMNGGLR